MTEEKFGTIFINGKLVNLDEAPLEELKKILEKTEKEKKELKKQIAYEIEHFDDEIEI